MATSALARVETPSKQVDTRYGTKINVVFMTENGEKVVKWDKPDNEELKSLVKGQVVRLITNDNNKVAVVPVENAEDIKPKTAKTTAKATKTTKSKLVAPANLTERMQKLFNLYMACDDVVRNSNKTYQKEESIRSIVTTIFLQATKGISYGC
ncbi:MAG: hypothetical protein ACI4S3_02875 [Candidatus Gastranaerophilaceae bacterium]